MSRFEAIHRDKNGVEIYEGSILRLEKPDKNVPAYDFYDTEHTVVYAYGMFVLQSDNLTLHPFRDFSWGSTEVIRNT